MKEILKNKKYKFELTADDFLEFNKHFLYTNRRHKIVKLILFCGIIAGAFSQPVSIFISRGSINQNEILTPLAVSIVFLILLSTRKFSNFVLKKSIKKGNYGSIFGKYEIDFPGDESFFVKGPTFESRNLWSAIVKTEETEKYIFLYNTSNCAHIIPKFKSEIVDLSEK